MSLQSYGEENTRLRILREWDEDGNLPLIHCTGGFNNVVITGISGFTSIAKPNCFSVEQEPLSGICSDATERFLV